MSFYSVQFLLFFFAACFLLHRCKSIKKQQLLILLLNVLFYSYWDVRFLVVLGAMIAVCYFSAIAYSRKAQRIFIVLPVVSCLVTLGVFKYYEFFIDAFCQSFGIENPASLQLVLPLGISFYTFQALSYIFDVKHRIIAAEKSFIKLAAYISFFPQLTAGPIVKARDFLPQLDFLHKIKKENVYEGLQLFLRGLTKKVVVADRVGLAVNAVFQAPAAFNGISILLALLGYAIQIYCDFSGYSDMAIGIARIWDFDLGKNFNMPYLAKNPSDFWRRWHISLSSWFKEYVYIPLGGSRNGELKTYCNLMITMLLSGLWHGANWTFLLWGALHGMGSVVDKMAKKYRRTAYKAGRSSRCTWLCILMNNIFVILLWGIFRAETVQMAFELFAGLFRNEGILYVNAFAMVYALMMVIWHLFVQFRHNGETVKICLDLDMFKNKVLVSLWFFLIVMFAYVGDSAFIYAQF